MCIRNTSVHRRSALCYGERKGRGGGDIHHSRGPGSQRLSAAAEHGNAWYECVCGEVCRPRRAQLKGRAKDSALRISSGNSPSTIAKRPHMSAADTAVPIPGCLPGEGGVNLGPAQPRRPVCGTALASATQCCPEGSSAHQLPATSCQPIQGHLGLLDRPPLAWCPARHHW